MNRVFMAAAALMLLPVMCAARATIPPTPKVHDQTANVTADAARMVQDGFDDLQHNHFASGRAKLAKAIHGEGFTRLPADLRYRVLWLASILAEQAGEAESAHAFAMRATAFDAADGAPWTTRLYSAYDTDDYRDAAHCLAVLARHWPEALDDVNDAAIWRVHRQLRKEHATDASIAMLDALFDAKWQDSGSQPNAFWRDLALLHIQRNEIERATTVALRITSARTVLAMRVDKRFDPITLKHSASFDVGKLIAAQIKWARERMKAHPDRLQPVTYLQTLYLATGQYSRAIAVSDAALAHAMHGDGDTAYTDFANNYNWVLDSRSRAFERQGNWKQAVKLEVRAARRPEHGAMNVSQHINLGALYANLHQPDKAARAIFALGDMSPYGRMQLTMVKLKIAIEKEDKPATHAAMTYMREHRADAIRTWQSALLLRGNLDAAAAVLVQRLQKPDWRGAALVQMQHYADTIETPVETKIRNRWNVITARPDVLAAMRTIGRVEHFRIMPPMH